MRRERHAYALWPGWARQLQPLGYCSLRFLGMSRSSANIFTKGVLLAAPPRVVRARLQKIQILTAAAILHKESMPRASYIRTAKSVDAPLGDFCMWHGSRTRIFPRARVCSCPRLQIMPVEIFTFHCPRPCISSRITDPALVFFLTLMLADPACKLCSALRPRRL